MCWRNTWWQRHVSRYLDLNDLMLIEFIFNIIRKGDSGGPLFVKDSVGGKTKYVAAGVVSYGDGCASAGRFNFNLN